VTEWVQIAVSVVVAAGTALVSIMLARSKDLERIATMEAEIAAQVKINEVRDRMLVRIEEKLDRLIEGRAHGN
jgi:hypothetical protein